MFVEIAHHQTFNFVDQLTGKNRNLRKIGIQETFMKPLYFFLFLYIKFCVVYTHFTYVALKFQSCGKMTLKKKIF